MIYRVSATSTIRRFPDISVRFSMLTGYESLGVNSLISGMIDIELFIIRLKF